MLACRSPKHRAGGRALHQVWFGSVGADYKLAPRWTAALWLDMQQTTTATSGREAEVTART
jgi:hypothetical protein